MDRAWPFFFGKGRRERPRRKGRLAYVVLYCHQAELVGDPVSPQSGVPARRRRDGSGGAGVCLLRPPTKAHACVVPRPHRRGNLGDSRDGWRGRARGPDALRVGHGDAKARPLAAALFVEFIGDLVYIPVAFLSG